MANNPSMVVRVAANLAELKKNLAEGKNQIEATTAGMQKLATSFQGDRLIQNAHNVAAAVQQIGGASKLTEAEQARVNRTVEAALAKYQALGREAPQALHDLANATRQAEKPLLSMSNLLQGAVAGATAAVTARLLNAGSALMDFGVESLKRGAQLESLRASFTNLSGGVENATATLNAMRRGSLGLTDDMQLMQAANKALLLNLGLSSQQMGDLAKTATLLGRAMGQDAAKSVDDLITALGRSSPMILDNLGLSVKVGEANEKYAAALGKTAEQLTDAEKKQAFMSAAMEAARLKVTELGEAQLTATEHAGKLWTSFRNLADATANLIVQNPIVESQLANLSEGFSTLETLMREGAVAAYAMHAGLSDLEVPVVSVRANLDSLKSTIDLNVMSTDDLFRAMEGTGTELARATQRVETLKVEAEGLNVVWGEVGNITRFQIAGIINPALQDFKTDTDNVTKAMDELYDALARIEGKAIEIRPVLESTMQLPWVEAKEAAIEVEPEIDGWFARIFGGAEGLGQGISSIFQAAFVGGGGALGAVQAFATQTLSSLLAMIPGIGQFVSAFAGPIIAMLSNLGSKVKDFFSDLFGGPSQAERNDRNAVKDWEDSIIAAFGSAEDGAERWQQVLNAANRALGAQGYTAEEVADIIGRLWKSSQEGGEETWRVIDELNRMMARTGTESQAIIDRIGDAIDALPDEVRIRVRGEYEAPDIDTGEGYAGGTISRGTWMRDFGRGTPAMLHGREAVIREDQAPAFARAVLGDPATDTREIARLLRQMPQMIRASMIEAMRMGA